MTKLEVRPAHESLGKALVLSLSKYEWALALAGVENKSPHRPVSSPWHKKSMSYCEPDQCCVCDTNVMIVSRPELCL